MTETQTQPAEALGDSTESIGVALDEMRIALQHSLDSSDALDQKSNMIFAVSGLILTLAISFQMISTKSRSIDAVAILVLMGILYLSSLGFALYAVRPQSYFLPIAADWDEIDKHLLTRSKRDAMLNLLAGYIRQVKANHEVSLRKAKSLRISMLLSASNVTITVIFALVQ